jgi:hypothetical protein
MNKLIFLPILSQAAFALQAPSLYTADSASDTTVQLTWRNNSTAYLGIIVLRKTAATGPYSVVDTAPGTATAFTDTVRPATQTTYYYALTAYSQTEQADTSNVDSVKISPKSMVFAPQNFAVSYDTLAHVVHMQFYDNSTVETGYKIYRSTNFAAFAMIQDIVSSIPSQKGVISSTDSAANPNTWYQYYVVAYNSQQSISSTVDTLYIFDEYAIARSVSKKCSLLNKLSSFPIKYKSWSLKSGDTIVLNEIGAPDSEFSIINVSNPSAPIFAGTGNSPASLLDRSRTKGPHIFGYNNPLACYKYSSGEITPEAETVDVIHHLLDDTQMGPVSHFLAFLSDTTFVIISGGFGIMDETWNDAITNTNSQTQINFLDHTPSPMIGTELLSVIAFNGKLFSNLIDHINYSTSIGELKIIDYNYSPEVSTMIQKAIEFPIIIDDIFIDAPVLKTANNVIVDTVKNLVFAFSDTELDVYNCQQAGVLHGIPIVSGLKHALRITISNGSAENLILLPHHTQPVSISIFDLSGKRIARMEGIQGETVAWPHQNRTGVYILRAIIDGNAVTAKVILNK